MEHLQAFGLKILRTPVQAPKANAYCERLMGTIRRECLDYVKGKSWIQCAILHAVFLKQTWRAVARPKSCP